MDRRNIQQFHHQDELASNSSPSECQNPLLKNCQQSNTEKDTNLRRPYSEDTLSAKNHFETPQSGQLRKPNFTPFPPLPINEPPKQTNFEDPETIAMASGFTQSKPPVPHSLPQNLEDTNSKIKPQSGAKNKNNFPEPSTMVSGEIDTQREKNVSQLRRPKIARNFLQSLMQNTIKGNSVQGSQNNLCTKSLTKMEKNNSHDNVSENGVQDHKKTDKKFFPCEKSVPEMVFNNLQDNARNNNFQGHQEVENKNVSFEKFFLDKKLDNSQYNARENLAQGHEEVNKKFFYCEKSFQEKALDNSQDIARKHHIQGQQDFVNKNISCEKSLQDMTFDNSQYNTRKNLVQDHQEVNKNFFYCEKSFQEKTLDNSQDIARKHHIQGQQDVINKNVSCEKSLQEIALDISQRKNIRQGGTRGQKFMVETNHLELKINPKYETAIHYDVAITPDTPKRLMRKVWETFKNIHLTNYPLAFDDSKNVYSPTYLPFETYSGQVSISDKNSRQKSFEVVMKFATEVNLRALFEYMADGCVSQLPQDALQCVDVVLRNASSVRCVKVGRSFFSEQSGRVVNLGGGMEMWNGHFQSAVIGWKPFVNIDVVHKAFPSPIPVLDLMAEFAYNDLENISQQALNKTEAFLKGLKVIYKIPNATSCLNYRVNNFVKTPDLVKFVNQFGQEFTILQYFSQVKNYRIKYPYLPLLWVGSKDKKIYLPLELCTVMAGQVCYKPLGETQTANMIKNVTTNTHIRKEKIMKSINKINFNADPVVQAFGLNIGQNFENINARLLNSPALQYKNENVKPFKGVWKATEFLQPQNLENYSWTVLNFDRKISNELIENFVRMFINCARQLGMKVDNPTRPYPRLDRFTGNNFEQFLRINKDMKLIFVVIPDYPAKVYNEVKQRAELVVGSLTQCLKSKTMYKMNPSTVGNILLKVNSKLNGQNHTIAQGFRPPCLQKPCMIMGADVTHPSQDQKDFPSIAAVTASCDPKAFQYCFNWRLQPARKEIIQDLENIVKEQLKFFRRTCNQIPQRIIFFRDGVSEGQFQQVMKEEIQAIRRACSSLGTPGSYKPGITFLVVQKRHHTRFFPTNRNDSDDRNFNVRAGTVVDTYITHPTDIEYYLVSHASIQGVARPTKYRVLWDDCDTSEDELEALTYYLCHMFSRCTRSVSYPAPTYYAHLAALRAKVYIDGQNINMDNLEHEQNLRTVLDNIMKEKPMFFV